METKTVHFQEGMKNDLSFTPLAKPNFSSIRKMWIELCVSGEYTLLSEKFFALQENGLSLTRFFDKEGQSLLEWVLVGSEDITPFAFICDKVQRDLIQKAIEKDDYYVLDMFLMNEVGMEMRNIMTEKKLQTRVNKVDLLLKTCPTLRECLDERISKISNDIVKKNIRASIDTQINGRLVIVK